MFKDLNCLITGASSGIGAEFAKQLHLAGANLVLVARRVDLLNKMSEQFNFLRANSCFVFQADLANADHLLKLKKFISDHKVDLLVNNAGLGSFGYFENLDDQNLIDVNITASMQLAQAVIPQLKQNRSGGIISVSSICAFQPLPYMSTYAASKAFNFIHSLGLYGELKDFGVHVLTLCPGPTATEFGGVARVPGGLTGISRDTVEMVVRQALIAFKNKKLFVVTGVRSKIFAGLSRYLPECITVKIVERILKKVLKN